MIQSRKWGRFNSYGALFPGFGLVGTLLVTFLMATVGIRTEQTSSPLKDVRIILAGATATSSPAPTITLTATTDPNAPPPLKSDKYLIDTSLLTGDPCGPPCFQNIMPGKTTFTDALAKIKSNPIFSKLQTPDNSPYPLAVWSTKDGEVCCELVADSKTSLVNIILARVAPVMTIGLVIDKHRSPKYVIPIDYTPQEVGLQIFFPDIGVVILVVPGDANSTLTESSPVVAILFMSSKTLKDTMKQVALLAWEGYQSYQHYKNAKPVTTPVLGPTPRATIRPIPGIPNQ